MMMEDNDAVVRAFGNAFKSKFDRLLADMTPAMPASPLSANDALVGDDGLPFAAPSRPSFRKPSSAGGSCTSCAAGLPVPPPPPAPPGSPCSLWGGGAGGWGSAIITGLLCAAILGLVVYIYTQVRCSLSFFGGGAPARDDAPRDKRAAAVAEVTDAAELVPKEDAVTIFYASWCHHCKQLMPAFEKLAGKYAGKVAFKKCEDTVLRSSGDRAAALGINGYPQVVVFRGGKAVDKLVGNQGPDKLEGFLQKWFK
jgi:thiol-disulfide isomerase/thioredoxin